MKFYRSKQGKERNEGHFILPFFDFLKFNSIVVGADNNQIYHILFILSSFLILSLNGILFKSLWKKEGVLNGHLSNLIVIYVKGVILT